MGMFRRFESIQGARYTMIRISAVALFFRTGFGPLVGDVRELRDSVTFERGNRTIRRYWATTDHATQSDNAHASLGGVTRHSFLSAELRCCHAGSRHVSAIGQCEALPSARASKCEYDVVFHNHAGRTRAEHFWWLQSRQPRMSFPGFERRRPAGRTLGI
jgi:hypothetical protein